MTTSRYLGGRELFDLWRKHANAEGFRLGIETWDRQHPKRREVWSLLAQELAELSRPNVENGRYVITLDRPDVEEDRYVVLLACGHWVHTRDPGAGEWPCPVIEPAERNDGMQPAAWATEGPAAILVDRKYWDGAE